MSKTLSIAIALAFGLTAASGAFAETCRDAKGRFAKCPTAAAAPAKTAQCKDAKGKFTKCPTSAETAATPAVATTPPAAPMSKAYSSNI